MKTPKFFQPRGRLFLWMLPVVVMTSSAGCSTRPSADYSKVDLISVSGKIMFDNTPLALAVVTFEDPQLGTYSYAMTDSEGRYELQFDTVKKGVTPGEKVVRVSTTRKLLGLNSDEEGGSEESGEAGQAPAPSNTELIPDCYYRKSELRVTVSPDASTFDFDLKPDCSTKGAL